MRTIDEQTCSASPDIAFRVAADVEGWPDILPHYRWVRFLRKDSFAQGVVEMAAWRHFGPLGYPTWWVSEMEHDAAERVVRYRHVRGVTSGMDVVWRVSAAPGGCSHLSIVHEWTGPGWPLIGRFAAERVIGPRFVSHIAGLTLAGVAAEAERRERLAK
ncbi:MAG TPA: SRPBCC family protein [Longimicrobiales bacterium]|nr:SRPBCC family protein [Longimicrobiales bacterium]